MKRIATAVLVCLVATVPAIVRAEGVPVLQDTFVGSSTVNYGALSNINVGGVSSYQGLVQFDLGSLPAGTTGAGVAKATLILFVNKVGAAGSVNIDVANGAWTETGVNGTNAPVPGGVVATGVPVTTAGTYVVVDATQAVQNWLDHVTLNQGFLILAATPDTTVFFDSKESVTTSHAPQLDVTLNGPAGPPGATGPAGPPGPAGPTGPAGPNVLQTGSAPAPSLSFVGNPNTGLFSAAANTVNISTNGTSHFAVRPDGDLDMTNNIRQNGNPVVQVTNTNSSVGLASLNSATGSYNTGVGNAALGTNTSGVQNTAIGAFALPSNTTGVNNTAAGTAALERTVSGSGNSGFGVSTLAFLTTGSNNTAIGLNAGSGLTSGSNNLYIGNGGAGSESGVTRIGTAGTQNATFISGIRGVTPAANDGKPVVIDSNGQLGTANAISSPITLPAGTAAAPSLSFTGNASTGLFSPATNTVNISTNGVSHLSVRPDGDLDMTGNLRQNGTVMALANGTNSAFGLSALTVNTGSYNTAAGNAALNANTTGIQNTVVGAFALPANTTGSNNTAVGVASLQRTATTSGNTGVGVSTFAFLTNGGNNTALGLNAGSSLTNGSNNVYINSAGASTESGVTRIGTAGTQTATFIAGIRGATPAANDGLPVVIDSNGQLGTAAASSTLANAVAYERYDVTLSGNSYGYWYVSCPSDHPVLIGGGCGHRDYNAAQSDITVNYTGPDPAGPTTQWACRVTNASSASRSILLYAVCSR